MKHEKRGEGGVEGGTLACHACGAAIGREHPAFDGFLANRRATLGAQIVELRLRLHQPFAFQNQKADCEYRLRVAREELAALPASGDGGSDGR